MKTTKQKEKFTLFVQQRALVHSNSYIHITYTCVFNKSKRCHQRRLHHHQQLVCVCVYMARIKLRDGVVINMNRLLNISSIHSAILLLLLLSSCAFMCVHVWYAVIHVYAQLISHIVSFLICLPQLNNKHWPPFSLRQSFFSLSLSTFSIHLFFAYRLYIFITKHAHFTSVPVSWQLQLCRCCSCWFYCCCCFHS